MPVINFTYQDLEELLGTEIDKKELLDLLPMIGSDVEGYDDENVKVEFFPNRPDYLSVEGVARTLKGFLDIEKGLPKYNLEPAGVTLSCDPKLESIRPYVACCIIEGIELNENKLKQLMDFQEDLHWVLGRDRKKVAIGIHNLDVLKPPFRYLAAEPDGMSFVPLECEEELTLREILDKHKKGRSYAHLIKNFDYYPLIVDADNNVLSMPPIINGELTKLTVDTKNFLVDVTGTDQRAVERTLIILATSFAEAGAQIKTMEIVYPNQVRVLPDLTPQKKMLNVEKSEKTIGISLTADEAVDALKRVRMGALKVTEEEVEVLIPPFRVDILHELDLTENVAIGYSFPKLKPELPQVATVAREDPRKEFEKLIREIMVGLGLVEVMSLMLTSEENHYQKMQLPEEDRIEVAQPISQDRTMIRQSLLNGLLEFLDHNKHEDLPQKIFEVGEVVYLDDKAETRTIGARKLASAITHSHANFTEIKSLTAALLTNLGLDMNVEPLIHPSFVKGRCARVKGLKDGKTVLEGVFGEIDPVVITGFGLEYPMIAFEVEFV
ncbi:MAG TPA: phenylalanine--tRNA ligase subunit beta [Methanobacteriaceae archaeon]|nr:phenylalanine--tRNA ligase subunit beta [Methanobacteriaceae archaeon]